MRVSATPQGTAGTEACYLPDHGGNQQVVGIAETRLVEEARVRLYSNRKRVVTMGMPMHSPRRTLPPWQRINACCRVGHMNAALLLATR
jgi:hypothetical protein